MPNWTLIDNYLAACSACIQITEQYGAALHLERPTRVAELRLELWKAQAKAALAGKAMLEAE